MASLNILRSFSVNFEHIHTNTTPSKASKGLSSIRQIELSFHKKYTQTWFDKVRRERSGKIFSDICFVIDRRWFLFILLFPLAFEHTLALLESKWDVLKYHSIWYKLISSTNCDQWDEFRKKTVTKNLLEKKSSWFTGWRADWRLNNEVFISQNTSNVLLKPMQSAPICDELNFHGNRWKSTVPAGRKLSPFSAKKA